jgi:hypothetical protein
LRLPASHAATAARGHADLLGDLGLGQQRGLADLAGGPVGGPAARIRGGENVSFQPTLTQVQLPSVSNA